MNLYKKYNMVSVLKYIDSKELILQKYHADNYEFTIAEHDFEITYRPVNGRITFTCKYTVRDVPRYVRISYSWTGDVFSVQYGDRLDRKRELYVYDNFSWLLKPEGYFMENTMRKIHFTNSELREAVDLVLNIMDKCKVLRSGV